ncbi:MAG TPA: T9SS type A sorting domain-containing protein [Ignavibacteria bacterium]|nr:T9SS type A sorting domain-containing protein [Ignavibacteria bacterium]
MKTILTILALFIFTNVNQAQIKKVLWEEFTNASCAPCAANNPALKAYMDSKGDTIIGIKYHTNFPGFDPMYNLNPTQVEQRRGGYYTDVNAVPWLKGDGNVFPDIWPFSQANFDQAFNTRKVIVPPLRIIVFDVKGPGDSITSTVQINITQTLPAGNYKLRVMAVEKVVQYATPPGNNGEMIFPHVFRKGVPNMDGISIPTNTGIYTYYFRYKREIEWVDSNIVTVAFVQNDGATNKEVLNVNLTGDLVPVGIENTSSLSPEKYSLSQNYPNPFNPSTSIKFSLPKSENVKLVVFNSLGKEVATLVNEKLISGEYEIEFEAGNLASGVYYYTIESGEFRETRKMVLMK